MELDNKITAIEIITYLELKVLNKKDGNFRSCF